MSRKECRDIYGLINSTIEVTAPVMFSGEQECTRTLLSAGRLESVSKLRQGLQSFRSMRRMEASFKNARALRLRFSQSLARRRHRLSHAIVRSTIQRLGNWTNPLARSDRLTISVSRRGRILARAFAKSGP